MVCILLEPRLPKLAQAAKMETRGQNDAGAETEMGENGETELRTQARTSKIRAGRREKKASQNGDHEDVNPKPCYQLQPKSRSYERAKSDWATVIWQLDGAG